MLLKIIFYIVALASGIVLSLEGAVYGELGKTVGELESSFYNFFAGSIIYILLVTFFGKGNVTNAFKTPKWYLLGGLFAVIYLTILVFSIPSVGVGISMIAVVVGQMLASMIIEHFGWLGSKKVSISKKRILSLLFMLVALFLIY
ncbi:DMT family transporter [Priestia megaterium]|uniref:DMT family transporter n=1 Tax=Priestia megaterium TaxID=1404 RepID=UPI003A812B95